MKEVWRTLPSAVVEHILNYDDFWVKMRALRRFIMEDGGVFQEPDVRLPLPRNSILQKVNRIDRCGQTYFHVHFKDGVDDTNVGETVFHLMSLDEKDSIHERMDSVLRLDGLMHTPRHILRRDYLSRHYYDEDDNGKIILDPCSRMETPHPYWRMYSTSISVEQYHTFIHDIKQEGDYYEHFLYNALFVDVAHHLSDKPFRSPEWEEDEDSPTLPLNYVKIPNHNNNMDSSSSTFMVMWYSLDIIPEKFDDNNDQSLCHWRL